MAKTKIPSNSLLSTEFSKVWVRPTRRPNRYKLILGGEELNTVWFQDRPLRGYGHFQFDEITGRRAWKKLFAEDNPNSILSGNGKSLAFETGHFSSKGDGRVVSRIKPLTGGNQQDIATGRWLNSSLLIDSTSSSDDDSTPPYVEGLTGLLLVGGALTLYKKIRANRAQEAVEDLISESDQEIANAEQRIDQLEIRIEDSRLQIDALDGDAKDTAEKLSQKNIRIQESESKLEAAIQNGDNQQAALLQSEISELEDDSARLSSKLNDLSNERTILVEESEEMHSLVLSDQQVISRLTSEKEVYRIYESIATEDLEKNLREIAADENIYEVESIKKSLPELDDVDTNALFRDSIEDVNSEIGELVESVLLESAEEGVIEESVIIGFLKGGLTDLQYRIANGIPLPVDGIDPITNLYSEEFIIQEDMIFRKDKLFDILRDDLSDIGYESEVSLVVEYVQGPEYAGEAGGLIGAFTEGSLVAEEAVGAIDIASIGLGGEAFVDGLALEVGGDALLGEIALDLLEIAVFL